MSPTPDASRAQPTLVLVPQDSGPGGASTDPIVLGLRLKDRAKLAARRAGFGRTVFAERGFRWQSLIEEQKTGFGNLVVAACDILAETDWLKLAAANAADEGSWAASPDRLILVPGSLAGKALAALDEAPPTIGMAEVIRRLSDRLAAPSPLPSGIDPLRVSGPGDVRPAERRLMQALVKDTDGFMARHVERPISLAISRILAVTPVTPNQMTLISVAIGLLGAPFFLSAQPLWQTVGALLFLAHSILDGCDGELARLKFAESRWGGILDFWGDNVVHSAIFACMALGWSNASGQSWPLLLGFAAVAGTLGSAGFVYWRTMRAKTGSGPLYTSVSTEPGKRFSQTLDALSRRDFIYLVITLALFGHADWFLLATAIGAPIFFFLLVFLAARENRSRAA